MSSGPLRLLSILVGLAVLAALAFWLTRPSLARRDLGPGELVVAHPEAPVFLVGDGQGAWASFPAAASEAAEGRPLPEGLVGLPLLASTGAAHALRGSEVLTIGVDGSVTAAPLPEWLADAPGGLRARLAGVDGRGEPVAVAAIPEGAGLFVRRPDGGDWDLLEVAGRVAVAASIDARIVVSASRPALAFVGEEGWEAWLYDDSPPVRHVARNCRGAEALFTPDGAALVVEGKVDGLSRLELSDGRLEFMAAGNLGTCERVPFSVGFRPGPPELLVAPQWDFQGHLQIVQTHLKGGGRFGFSTGFAQHYAPAVSHDGRHMVYVQAQFSPDGRDAFREELYVFDFDHPTRSAVRVGRRTGGAPDQGPAFVGRGGSLVFIADGRVLRIERRVDGNP